MRKYLILDILVRTYVETCFIKFEACIQLTSTQRLYFVEVLGF